MFKKKEESKLMLDIICTDGRRYSVERPGHLNTTKHDTVLQLLERRASRLRKDSNQLVDKVHDWSIDETGTIDTSRLSIRGIEQQEKLDIRGVSDEVLRVHGTMPGKKADGVIRLLYENVNSLPNRICENQKLEKAKDLIHEWGADIVGMVEHRQNLKHKNNNNGWNQLFRRGEEDVRSVVAHNVHENIAPVQEGGVGLLMFGPLLENLDMKNSGKDESGLGRWTTMVVQGEGIRTRIVCGYNPCKSTQTSGKPSSTSYAQHRRYLIMKKKDTTTCPRTLFLNDLVKQLKQWRQDGDRLVVCLDANDHIYRGAIGRALTDTDGLGMKEVIKDYTGRELGPTYFRGSMPIDGIWATQDIQIANACVMPAGYGIGDHRLFVVDMTSTSVVGEGGPKIQRPAARRLTTRLPGVAERYADIYEENVIRHRLIEKLEAAQRCRDKKEARRRFEQVDKDSGQFMARAEKKCRRFKTGRIPFSPESVMWIKSKQIYQSLLEYRLGKRKNIGNLKRAARRQQIRRPLQLSRQEIEIRLRVCEKQLDHFRTSGNRYRKKHLLNRAEIARKGGNEVAARQILAIIERERLRSFWSRLRYSCGKKKGGSPTSVQVEGPLDTILEYNTQESMNKAIFDNIHNKRFHLAEAAPICNGMLRGEFGYNAISQTAQSILDGSYVFPDDFDEATRELCEEFARIRLKIPKDSLRMTINKEDWARHWGKAREDTSSSYSGRHFGFYKAAHHSEYILHFQALLATLIFHRGVVLSRWACGLSVMLQKLFGCNLVSKLRSILLIEADFNAANKILFGTRMLDQTRKYRLMPGEIYSERGRTAEDGTLAKIITYDIARQFRIPLGISSVDADNCFDRVAHPIASMMFQALGVPSSASEALLSTIQEMKFFLRTGFGDSKEYTKSENGIKTQGYMQGNGMAPAGWTVVNISIIRAHKRKGHGGFFICPISKLKCNAAGVIFVDDTDLIHIRMDRNELPDETLLRLQESISSWGKLLIATGGSLKAVKCSYHLISFEWRPDGTWAYAENEKEPEYKVSIPLPDGSTAQIEHLGVNVPNKTLGSTTCPSGHWEGGINLMQTKSQEWATTVKEGKLSRRNVWFMMKVQFWPRVAFGICNSMAPFDVLSECLMKPYGQIQRLGGFRLSVRRELRQLDIGFYGIGCPDPAVECAIAQMTKILSHVGCKSDIAIQMQASLEAFMIEMGMSDQPFTEDYEDCNKWVTLSWLKTAWEKACRLRFKIELGPTELQPPRGENDYWLMKELRKICTQEELVRLNRVRLHQQVIFGSDIMDAGGRSLDKKYLKERPMEDNWSSLKFPNERPPARDFKLWRDILPQLRPNRGRLQMGPYVKQGHKLWHWTYDHEDGKLYNWIRENVADIYEPSISVGLTTRANAWGRRRIKQHVPRIGDRCTVEQVGTFRNYRIISYSKPPTPEAAPTTLWEVLEKWGSTWLWKDVKSTGNDSWLKEAIRDDTLLAVTDGSFMSKRISQVNSCAFIIECTRGRGRIVGHYPEHTMAACAYRGELLGLLAIHLILLAANKIDPNITGVARVYSDCLGALNQVKNLPTDRIPSKCKHSDILKTIMIQCRVLSFRLKYSHVEAHQDDHQDFSTLSRPSQLNCACDLIAKQCIEDLDQLNLPPQQRLPLESVCVWAGQEKITTDSADRLRYWAHRYKARKVFSEASILSHEQFDKVDWEMVHLALHSVPRMFQAFACKQVFDIGGTNRWLARFDKSGKKGNKCPSCLWEVETADHIVHCCHAGRVETMQVTIRGLDKWMRKVNTDPAIRECIYFYLMERGTTSMLEIWICNRHRYGVNYRNMAREQDEIGWRRFLEGMISSEFRRLQHKYYSLHGLRTSVKQWATDLITKLLEVTHGQWLYRNIQVHDKVSGALATIEKEKIQMEIEDQQAIGFDGFLEEDAYLGECNLGDLEITSGTDEQYWLLAVRAAREAAAIEGRKKTTTAGGTTT